MKNVRAPEWKVSAWIALVCGLVATPSIPAAGPPPARPAVLKTSSGTATHHAVAGVPHQAPNIPHTVGTTAGIHSTVGNTTGFGNAGFGTTAFGTTGFGNAGFGNAGFGRAGGNANSQIITTLRQAHTLLANTNNDYNGHRAKAAEYTSQAIRELGLYYNLGPGGISQGTRIFGATIGGVNGSTSGVKVGAGNGSGGRVPQAQSDAQLQKALGMIEGVSGQISTTHKAAQHVQSAIAELSTALQVR